MSYDSYRPGPDPRLSERRPTNRNNAEDTMSWRREEPKGRRGRRFSEDIPSTNSLNKDLSFTHSEVPNGSQREARYVNSSSMEPGQSKVSLRPQVTSRQLSASVLPVISDRRPSAFTTLSPSHHQSELHKPSRDLAIDTQIVHRTSDPRLRNQVQSRLMSQDQAPSPSHSSSDEVQEGQSYGWLVKELANVVAGRNEMKRELGYLSTQQKKIEENLANAQKMFTSENAYIESLKRDLQESQLVHRAKKTQLEDLTKREEAALQALSTKNSKTESLAAELRGVKKDFEEERKRSRQLQSSNEDMLQQLAQLKGQIQTIGEQMKQQENRMRDGLQEQLIASEKLTQSSSSITDTVQTLLQKHDVKLSQFQKDLREVRTDELEPLRREVKEQELAVARLNDLFVTNETFKDIVTQVSNLSQKLISLPPASQAASSDHITQSQLNSYVTVFNAFELKMNERLRELEDRNSGTTTDLQTLATLETLRKDLQALMTEQTAREALTQSLNKLENTSKSLIDLTSRHSGDLMLLDQRANALTRQVQNLETKQQSMTGALSSVQSYAKLQQYIDALRSTSQSLSQASQAHTHSIESLNQRFNNLTSDQLARQMLGLIEPMLTTIKPQVADMSTQLLEVRSIQETLRSQQTTSLNALGISEVRTLEVRNALDRLDKMNKDIGARLPQMQANIDNLLKDSITNSIFQGFMEDTQRQISEMKSQSVENSGQLHDKLQTKYDLLESSIAEKIHTESELIKSSTETTVGAFQGEQQSSLTELVRQMEEARDSIDARLVIVEKTLSDQNTGRLMLHHDQDNTHRNMPTSTGDTLNETPELLFSTADKTITQPMAHTRKDPPSASSKNMESTAKSSTKLKANSSQVSPLVKHFRPQSDEDSLSDTIDATPKPRTHNTKMLRLAPLIEIEDSDQDVAVVEKVSEHSSDPLLTDQDLQVEIQKWQKPAKISTKSSNNGVKNGRSSGPSRPAIPPVERGSNPKPKRKREPPKSLSENTPSSSGSIPSSSQSSKHKKKKPNIQ